MVTRSIDEAQQSDSSGTLSAEREQVIKGNAMISYVGACDAHHRDEEKVDSDMP